MSEAVHLPDDQRLHAAMGAVVTKVLEYNPGADVEKLWHAFRLAYDAHAGQQRRSGEPFFTHAIAVTDVLADLRLDVDTLVASLVHDVVEDTNVELATIGTEFGAEVARMVDGVTKISEIRTANPEARRAENYRKLILSIAQDPRTVLIKLADRLHNMRTIEYLAEPRQREIAQETLDVYAPLAHRFGIAMIKWELEDRAFKVLQPERYFEIESGINQTRADRERLIEQIRVPLSDALARSGIRCEITGRPKHFYSINRKMREQQIGIDRMYDLLAMRIITDTKADCYHALGVIHSIYPPLSDRIKDYIATPKPNMYQSLHTTVKVPGGKYIEVQIRTREMHERSEIGIAAHWRYKEGRSDQTDFVSMVKWLRQVMEWQQDVTDPREFMETLKIDFFQDEVFVFSPAGDLFQLPRGSTPLDFAFRIHSEVGLHCVGAKVNGRIVSLRTPLENRDTVEILTAKNARPSTSWLEIVKTGRAKHHIRRWIKSTQLQESVRLGHDILEREFQRKKLRLNVDRDLDEIALQVGYSDLEKMLAAVGRGELAHQKIINRLLPVEPQPNRNVLQRGRDLYESVLRRSKGGVRVAGIDNLMVNFARCCQPIPGDEITGVITRGRGVTVHRVGCTNLNDPNLDPERLIEVTWDASSDQTFQVKLIIMARDRRNLLADISKACSDEGANIQSGEFSSENEVARATLVVEVRNLNNLQHILRRIKQIPHVERIERYQLG
ncbi:MAG: bifunctional (p)ppGpp synthetase/guanosine-3',5'-bis(diphosphate) 3'-pyrophosphohydrolase [Candidatus Krumholzibacteriia bacterium]